MAAVDRGKGVTPRSAPGCEDLAGALAGYGRPPLLRQEPRSVLGRSQHRRAGPLGDLDQGEAVRLVKRAWRGGYHGLSAALAVMWETQLSPGDVRALTASQLGRNAQGRSYLTDREKTGKPVGAVLSARAGFVLEAYLKELGVEILADARVQEPLWRPLPEECLRRRLPKGARGRVRASRATPGA